MRVERKYYNSSFGKISYIQRAGKIPIIFLHGLGGTGNSWTRLIPYLPDKYGLYLIDLLGHGRSERPKIEYTIEKQGIVIREFVESEGLEDVTLMGNSYGGWVSLWLTLDHIEPSHLILEDSAGINVTFAELPPERRDRIVSSLLENNKLNSREVIESIITNDTDPKWKLTENELKAIKVKTLIIWGERDTVIEPVYGERMNSLISGSILTVINKAGHVPHIERPDLVAKAMIDFMK